MPVCTPGKINISIDGKADARQNVFQRGDFLSSQADCDAQLNPGFNAAGIIRVAVVIQDPLNPDGAGLAVRTISQNIGIFDAILLCASIILVFFLLKEVANIRKKLGLGLRLQ